jgi:hypothetical protein
VIALPPSLPHRCSAVIGRKGVVAEQRLDPGTGGIQAKPINPI